MRDPRETLNRIRRQADAATEGPWVGIRYPDGLMGRVIVSGELGVCIAEDFPDDADAEFIAHARTAVPALLDALEKVLRLHPRVVVLHADPEFGRMEDDAICGACIVNHEPADWPCPTVEAITTALNGDAA